MRKRQELSKQKMSCSRFKFFCCLTNSALSVQGDIFGKSYKIHSAVSEVNECGKKTSQLSALFFRSFFIFLVLG